MYKLATLIFTGLISLNSFSQSGLSEDYVEKRNAITAKINAVKNGNILPDFRYTNIFNDTISKANFKAKKIIYINIWASWCASCIKELPEFLRLRAKYKNITFVTASIDSDRSAWHTFFKSRNINPDIFDIHIGNDEAQNPLMSFTYFVKNIDENLVFGWQVPKYVILDKDLTILNNNAAAPDENILKSLNNE
ncbi:MAG: TlpA disulfide reductase family protein [Bacteroidota bacterium]